MTVSGRAWAIAIAGFLLSLALVGITLNLLRLNNPETLIAIAPVAREEARPVTVFVGGAVTNPGVYSLTGDARVEGAIAAAGGFSPDANLDGINRALRLRDEDQIIVPRKGEATATPARPAAGAAAPLASPAGSAAPAASARRTATEAGGRIRINTASATELARLPGVGAKIAQDIIDYRIANGPFTRPADLAKVKGISERMVADWAELVTFEP
jgi:competence protein ComEA